MRVSNGSNPYTYQQQKPSTKDKGGLENSKDLLWSQISRMREKLQAETQLPNFLKTVRGVGYSFDPQYMYTVNRHNYNTSARGFRQSR